MKTWTAAELHALAGTLIETPTVMPADHYLVEASKAIDAFAERIKAGESAVPFAWCRAEDLPRMEKIRGSRVGGALGMYMTAEHDEDHTVAVYLTQPSTSQVEVGERSHKSNYQMNLDDFEAFAVSMGFKVPLHFPGYYDLPPRNYSNISLELAWQFWQRSRIALAAHPAEPARPAPAPACSECALASAKISDAERNLRIADQNVEMYASAWAREIGAPYRAKTHRIDSLVLTTKDRMAELSKLRDAAEPAQAAQGSDMVLMPTLWRPIDTAPKDGTPLLFCDADGGDSYIGRWSIDHEYLREWWADAWAPPSHNPDFWMPLPAAPTPAKESLG